MQVPTTFDTNKMKFLGIQLVLATLLVAGATLYVSKNPISTIFKAGNKEKEVTLTYASDSISAAPGETVSITPFIGFTQKIPGYISLAFTYDAEVLTFLSSDDSHIDPLYEIIIPPQETEGKGNMREIILTYAMRDLNNTPQSEALEISTLSFTVVEDKQTRVGLNNQNSQIVFTDESEADIKTESVMINAKSGKNDSPPTDVSEPAVTDPSPTIEIVQPPNNTDPFVTIEPQQ